MNYEVTSHESATHTLSGNAYIFADGRVSIEITGETWHSYEGCAGYQGFDRPQNHSYPSKKAAENAGFVFGRQLEIVDED